MSLHQHWGPASARDRFLLTATAAPLAAFHTSPPAPRLEGARSPRRRPALASAAHRQGDVRPAPRLHCSPVTPCNPPPAKAKLPASTHPPPKGTTSWGTAWGGQRNPNCTARPTAQGLRSAGRPRRPPQAQRGSAAGPPGRLQRRHHSYLTMDSPQRTSPSGRPDNRRPHRLLLPRTNVEKSPCVPASLAPRLRTAPFVGRGAVGAHAPSLSSSPAGLEPRC